jgi:hypothetical protein
MRIQDDLLRMTKGEAFSAGVKMSLSRPEPAIVFRMEYIESLIAGRTIVHLGCADHVSSIEKKLRADKWFHKRLSERAKRCLGIDIDERGIEAVHALGYRDAIRADLLTDGLPDVMKNVEWDYMVLGEILEHQDNPVHFLRGIAAICRPWVKRFIISTPNAFRSQNFISALRHVENINSDHRYWFSPYTLVKVGTAAGLFPEHFRLCQSFRPGFHRIDQKLLLRVFPAFRDCIVMVFALTTAREEDPRSSADVPDRPGGARQPPD